MTVEQVPGSFRDPDGFLFRHEGTLYRQVNSSGQRDLDLFLGSGLYEELAGGGLVITHEPGPADLGHGPEAYRILRPRELSFISYPFEWCFGQLKDAALLTLELQDRALRRGLILKDASAYNIQFEHGRPLLIDTLSFTAYEEGSAWPAYRQFCQHFLAPLALMASVDPRLAQLSRVHLDGVPLDLGSRLLPWRTRWRFGLGLHLHLHARSQKRHEADAGVEPRAGAGRMTTHRLRGLVDSLRSTVSKLEFREGRTEWSDYYDATHNYGDEGLDEKARAVEGMLDGLGATSVWDLGANTGRFSRLASRRGIPTVAWDVDPACVEANYRAVRRDGERDLLPLVADLTNPSPGLGWHHSERQSMVERGPAGAILALGLVHHLAISNNTPLPAIARFMRALAPRLIVEFVPKEDSQVQRLLRTREDIFPDYNREGFERAFSTAFRIDRAVDIPGTRRRLYLMTAGEAP